MIGKRIQTARMKRGISQKDLALALGLSSPQFISNIEREKAPLPPHFIPTLSNLLGIPEKTFIDDLVSVYRKRVERNLRKI